MAAFLVLPASAAAPAAGDTYVYRVINVYNGETRGQVTYRVEKVDADRMTESVSADTPVLGAAHTEVVTRDGNWIRHPLVNHDQPVEYEFSPAYPAYAFPLDTGKTWSVRVTGTQTATGQQVSVRVDGEVVGSERVTVPAGSFDTIKVRRATYAGDFEFFRRETNIIETLWYAPALGRAVRRERDSSYMDPSRCGRGPCNPMHGDWDIFELVAAIPAPH